MTISCNFLYDGQYSIVNWNARFLRKSGSQRASSTFLNQINTYCIYNCSARVVHLVVLQEELV